MRLLLLSLALLGVASPVPEQRYFRYERTVQVSAPGVAQACVALPADVFAKAAPGLTDLRLYAGDREVPLAVRTAQAAVSASRPVLPLNAGVRDGRTEFDAAMPAGTYSDIELQITGANFQAKVEVSGSQAAGSGDARHIGTYTIFDLSNEKSGRNTVLHLPASDFRILHFRIDGPIKPDAVTGIAVLAATNAPEPPYTTVTQSTEAIHMARSTTLTFTVPAHVPVDRVLFQPGAEPTQFSRSVAIKAVPAHQAGEDDEQSAMTYTGTLVRLVDRRDGQTFHHENSSVGTGGQVFEAPATWTVTVDNGDDQPLQLGRVQLQVLERDLCFPPSGGAGGFTLRYGDGGLAAPQYDFAAQFSPDASAASAILGPEQQNPGFQSRPDARPFTERHPALLWAALVAVILLLGGVALRSRPKR